MSSDIGLPPSPEVVSRRMHIGPTCQGVVMTVILVLALVLEPPLQKYRWRYTGQKGVQRILDETRLDKT
jgi:hypothetical protein